jgi:hypothetical protein
VTEFPSWLDWLPDGMHSWEAMVAISTAVLAFATFYLGFQTRGDVRSSRRAADAASASASVAQQALTSSVRPILVSVVDGGEPRVGPGRGPSDLVVSVALRNVGAGLALLEGPALEIASQDYTRWESTISASAIPVGESARFSFALLSHSAAARVELESQIHRDGFAVVAQYRDMDGNQPGKTRAECKYDRTSGWSVTQIQLSGAASEEPFAVLPGRSVTIRVADQGVGEDSTSS